MRKFSEQESITAEYRELERQFLEDLCNFIKEAQIAEPNGIKPIGNSGLCYSVPFSALAGKSWDIKTIVPKFQQTAIAKAIANKETSEQAKKYIENVLKQGFVKDGNEKIFLSEAVIDFLNDLL